jgi:hypothetical protein
VSKSERTFESSKLIAGLIDWAIPVASVACVLILILLLKLKLLSEFANEFPAEATGIIPDPTELLKKSTPAA